MIDGICKTFLFYHRMAGTVKVWFSYQIGGEGGRCYDLQSWLFVASHFSYSSVKLLLKQGGQNMGRKTFKVGRDAKTGQFITVKSAEKRKSTAVVETMRRKKNR